MIRPSSNTRGTIAGRDRDVPPSLPQIEPKKALVVGNSPINRVVVSKIVERSGLKPTAQTPEAATQTLRWLVPGAVILDGGASNRDCEELMAQLDALRRLMGGGMPCVILLSTTLAATAVTLATPTIDAVVAKPITPEQLQPVVERLMEEARLKRRS